MENCWLRLLAIVCILGTAPWPIGAVQPPNIVIVLADDLGFSDLGCYGGEIATPNLDALANEGLRFTQFYNSARCWPSRAAILTGYYPQQVNRDPAGKRPAWATLLPALLKPAGYRSYHSGKWHIDGEVLAGGFNRSYRFEDWNHYFTPRQHFLDDKPLPPVEPHESYYATTEFADRAIEFLTEHQAEHADKPFFLYLAHVAPHFPLQAPQQDIARYEQRYMQGWEAIRQQRWSNLRSAGIVNCELSPLDADFAPRYFKPKYLKELGWKEVEHAVPWSSLQRPQQKFQAKKMAIHAAMVNRLDTETGRVFEQIKQMNAWENTLVVFLSDNGADASIIVRGDGHDRSAAPGSAASFLCLGPGWASAANSPFRRHKVWTHEGGISTPCIIRWPQADPEQAGMLRTSPAHIIDLVPTILELAKFPRPQRRGEQTPPPLPGKSLTATRTGDARIARDQLYWHHEGNRALRIGDMKLVSERESADKWELYDLSRDRSEMHDLAAERPNEVESMAERWRQLDDQFRRQASVE